MEGAGQETLLPLHHFIVCKVRGCDLGCDSHKEGDEAGGIFGFEPQRPSRSAEIARRWQQMCVLLPVITVNQLQHWHRALNTESHTRARSLHPLVTVAFNKLALVLPLQYSKNMYVNV